MVVLVRKHVARFALQMWKLQVVPIICPDRSDRVRAAENCRDGRYSIGEFTRVLYQGPGCSTRYSIRKLDQGEEPVSQVTRVVCQGRVPGCCATGFTKAFIGATPCVLESGHWKLHSKCMLSSNLVDSACWLRAGGADASAGRRGPT